MFQMSQTSQTSSRAFDFGMQEVFDGIERSFNEDKDLDLNHLKNHLDSDSYSDCDSDSDYDFNKALKWTRIPAKNKRRLEKQEELAILIAEDNTNSPSDSESDSDSNANHCDKQVKYNVTV